MTEPRLKFNLFASNHCLLRFWWHLIYVTVLKFHRRKHFHPIETRDSHGIHLGKTNRGEAQHSFMLQHILLLLGAPADYSTMDTFCLCIYFLAPTEIR